MRLYASSAKGVNCSTCKRSTTSTRWLCTHGIPWTNCHVHRELGFRCGSMRVSHKATLNRSKSSTCPLKVAKRLQAKIRRLGTLGEPKSSAMRIANSVGFATTFKATEVIKKRKRRSPTKSGPKGNACANRPVLMHVPSSSLSGAKANACSYQTLSSPSKPGAREREALCKNRPTKMARTIMHEHTVKCRGNCPAIWTINQSSYHR